MAQISMKKRHTLGAEKARGQIEKLAERLAERLGGVWRWQGSQAVCEARGATARVSCDDESVSIEIDLPFAMRPMKKLLEAKVEDYYERYFS